jgi:hypothetical protein
LSYEFLVSQRRPPLLPLTNRLADPRGRSYGPRLFLDLLSLLYSHRVSVVWHLEWERQVRPLAGQPVRRVMKGGSIARSIVVGDLRRSQARLGGGRIIRTQG